MCETLRTRIWPETPVFHSELNSFFFSWNMRLLCSHVGTQDSCVPTIEHRFSSNWFLAGHHAALDVSAFAHDERALLLHLISELMITWWLAKGLLESDRNIICPYSFTKTSKINGSHFNQFLLFCQKANIEWQANDNYSFWWIQQFNYCQ